MKEILRDINIQVLETKYVINLGHFVKIVPNIKWDIFKSVKYVQLVQPELVHPKPTCVAMAIDHQMAMIQVQVGKNFIDDVLIDGGSQINIIIDNSIIQLGLSKPNPTFYNLHMANQTIAKPLGLIMDLKIFVHGIPYIVTFNIINSNVLDYSYSMLLGCSWLKDEKISHDWGTNIVTIQGTSTMRSIPITKKNNVQTKRLKVLVCYDLHFGIADEEKDMMFATKLDLISIGTIVVLIHTTFFLNQPTYHILV